MWNSTWNSISIFRICHKKENWSLYTCHPRSDCISAKKLFFFFFNMPKSSVTLEDVTINRKFHGKIGQKRFRVIISSKNSATEKKLFSSHEAMYIIVFILILD